MNEAITKMIEADMEKFSPLPKRTKETDEEWNFILGQVGIERVAYNMGATEAYLRSEQVIAEKEKQIERLIKLIEQMYKAECFKTKPEEIEEAWQRFKLQNKLNSDTNDELEVKDDDENKGYWTGLGV